MSIRKRCGTSSQKPDSTAWIWGLTSLPGAQAIGMRALSSCTVSLVDVFGRDELLLGKAHKAWYETTRASNNERIFNAAMCLGMLYNAEGLGLPRSY